MDLFQNVKLEQLLEEKKDLIKVEGDTSVSKTLDLLKKENILSVPVYERGELIGIADVFNIMMSTSFFEDQSKFEEIKIAHVVRKSLKPSDLTILKHTDSLLTAMHFLCSHHQVLMSCPDRKGLKGSIIHQIITQSDILKFCSRNLNQISSQNEKLTTNLQGLSLVNPIGSKVIKISTNDSAYKGFVEMAKGKVPAVAVVDEFDHLMANLSASDLRGITSEKLSIVQLPVLEFLKIMQKADKLFRPVTANASSKLSELILSMTCSLIHRVWAIDSGEKPIGVITMTDIMRTLID